MKAVIISIRPEWCEKIVSGQKTIEVRKTRPKIETPFKCYIYCTANDIHRALVVGGGTAKQIVCFNYKTAIPVGGTIGNGKVIGEFICDDITIATEGNYCILPRKNTAIDVYDLLDYAEGKTLYGWHISDLVIYDKPKEMTSFRKPCERYGINCDMCVLDYTKCSNALPVERAPQSWCYVEELKC